jgi:glycosyltransferase involved in cell wall biosynthesis
MSWKPLVSIIIPFYNTPERFIRDAVDSVFGQTYRNWEILLVDDGSTGESTNIALKYSAQYPGRVRYLEHSGHQNRGVCASRNLGIRRAHGEYIALLDADDVWLPHKLEQQVAVLNSEPTAGMVYGATEYWHSWTGNPKDHGRDYVPKLGVPINTLVRPPKLLTVLFPLGHATAPCPSDLLLRREVVERVGGFEEEFDGICQLYEDQAFLAKIYLNESVFVAGDCWDRYRLHTDSCDAVAIREGQHDSAHRFFLGWLQQYLSTHQVDNLQILHALQAELRRYNDPYWWLHSLAVLYYCQRRIRKLVLRFRGHTTIKPIIT